MCNRQTYLIPPLNPRYRRLQEHQGETMIIIRSAQSIVVNTRPRTKARAAKLVDVVASKSATADNIY